jgi:hypothetical protein
MVFTSSRKIYKYKPVISGKPLNYLSSTEGALCSTLPIVWSLDTKGFSEYKCT